MKKVAALILLLIFLFNSMGYYFLFEVNRALVKREMTAYMKRTGIKLSILKISNPVHNPDFKRIDKREFLYQGRMYDILKEVKQGAVTVFYCIHDEKEQNLIAGFKRVSHSKLSQTLSDHVVKIALPVFYGRPLQCSGDKIHFRFLKVKLPSVYHHPQIPPPKVT
ncbi:MAG: hypothetical protein WCO93_08850 [bacterium]